MVGGLLAVSTGCTMCAQTPEDYAYSAYGGIVQRADMLHGRVGSAFSPAEGVSHGAVEGGEILAPETPYHGPVLMPPEYASTEAGSATIPAAPTQSANTAFDPGDILSSETR